MDNAAKGNVLMYLAAMCALGTVWMVIGALGDGGPGYWIVAGLLAIACVVSFRAYRAVLKSDST